MIMIIIQNSEQFRAVVPSSVSADDDTFTGLSDFFDTAEQWLSDTFSGQPLLEAVASESDTKIRRIFQRIIIAKAMITGSPSMDLVMTPNGFAVTSNQNLAPASKERVERLIDSLKQTSDLALEQAFILICSNENYFSLFRSGSTFEMLTRSLIWAPSFLRAYAGYAFASWGTLSDLRPVIDDCERRISCFISPEYYSELIEYRRSRTKDPDNENALQFIYQIVGASLKKIPDYPYIELLLNLLNRNPKKYPTYINSDTYKLKIFDRYENKKEDSAYFFG